MKYLLGTLLTLILNNATSQTQIGDDIDGTYQGEWSGWSVDMNGAGNRVVIGSIFGNSNNNPDSLDGAVKVYAYDGESWALLGNEIINDSMDYAFGYTVALSDDGNRIAIGMPSYDTPSTAAGAVKIMGLNNGQWVAVGNPISGENSYEQAGFSISLSSNGDTIAIGSPVYGQEEGRVRVFHYNGFEWLQLGGSINSQTIYERLGWDVALSGDGSILAVGAPHYSPNGIWDPEGLYVGQIRIYKFNGATWEEAYEPIQGMNEQEFFGEKFDLSKNGKRLIAGLSGYDSSGRTEAYELSEDSWIKIGNSVYTEDSYNLTNDVSISDDGSRIAVSYNSSYGTTKILEFGEDNRWKQVGDDIKGEQLAGLAGKSISLSGNGQFIAIGATHNNDGGGEAGHVRVFGDTSTPTSLKEHTENALDIYPTITRDLLFFNSENTGISGVELHSLLGDKLMDIGKTKNEIDVSFLAPGTYILLIRTRSGEQVIKRFIKM